MQSPLPFPHGSRGRLRAARRGPPSPAVGWRTASRLVGSLLVALVLCAGLFVGAQARAAEAVLLATDLEHGVTELVFVPTAASQAALPSASARLFHRPDAVVTGALLPQRREALAVADVAPGTDLSWTSALFHLTPGQPPRALVDRLYHAARPVVSPDGRVFVLRGVPGREPDAEALRTGRLRVDSLTLDEVEVGSGTTRTLYRTEGYLALPCGFLPAARGSSGELIVYRVAPDGAELLAVDTESLAVRAVASPIPPFARDFSVDPATRTLVYTQLDPASKSWVVERLFLDSGRRRRLVESTGMQLLPQLLPGGRVQVQPSDTVRARALGADVELLAKPRRLGSTLATETGTPDAFDTYRGFARDGATGVGAALVPGQLPVPFIWDRNTGERRALPHGGRRVEVLGLYEGGAP